MASTVRKGSVVEAQAAMISTKSGLALVLPMYSVVQAQLLAHIAGPISRGTDMLGDKPRTSHSAAFAEHQAAKLVRTYRELQQKELAAQRKGLADQLGGLAAQLERPAEQLDAVAALIEWCLAPEVSPELQSTRTRGALTRK